MPMRFLIACATVASLGVPALAEACVCMTRCASILQAELLFEATVVEVSPPRPGTREYVVRLTDVRPVRGTAAPDHLVVAAGDSCAYGFKSGTRYLVDARQFQPGRFSASACGHTMPLEDARGALAFLNAPRPELRPRLWGRVVSPFANQHLRSATPPRAVDGAVVTVSGPVTRTVATSASGDWAFPYSDLPDGDYAIAVEVPATRGDVGAPKSQRLTLAAGACASLVLKAPSTARARGRVVDRAGTPVAGVWVELFPLPYDQWAGGVVTAAESGADGRFEIEGIAPGRYAGGVSVPYPRDRSAHAPAVLRTTAGAVEIEVAPGATVDLPAVVAVPAPRVTVSGRVVTASDIGVAQAFIVVSAIDGFPQARTGGAATDGQGRFIIGLHRGVRYRVRVEVQGREVASTDVVAGDEPIVVTLPGR